MTRQDKSDCNFFAEMAGFRCTSQHQHQHLDPDSRVRRSARSPTRSRALPSLLHRLDHFPFPAHALHCTLPDPLLPVCISSLSRAFNFALPAVTRHRYRVVPQRPTDRPTSLPFTCYSACLPCHCWLCEPAAPICNLALWFSSSQSSQNIIFPLFSLATVLVDYTDYSRHHAGCSHQETQP
jgi:hypothetical protein